MLAANAFPPPHPATHFSHDVAPLPVLELQTQPCRISHINHFDRSFADSQLKHEASTSRESQRFLRRVTSKLSRPDAALTAAALSSHIESNGSAVVAQIYIEKLEVAAGHSSEGFEVPGNLLITAAKNSNLELVKLLASFSSVNSLGLALNIAILNKNRPIVKVLLENGGDTDHLPMSTLSAAAGTDPQIFQFILQAPKQLPHHKFGHLCAEAIQNGNSDVLGLLLRRLPDYTILGESTSRWNRDILLQIAITSQYESAFFAIAAATPSWPLLDGQLFFHVLDLARPLMVQNMMGVLLDLCRFSIQSEVQGRLEDLFFRCIKDGLDDILRFLVRHNLSISPRVISFACRWRNQQSLDILLKGQLQGDETVLSSIQTTFGRSAEHLREKALVQLLNCHNEGPWMQQELLRAVSLGQSELIESLINAGASVDANHAECLRLAVTIEKVSVVKALLAHDVSLPTLQSIFPLIGRSEILSRRLIIKLFLKRGLSGDCVDIAFNELLCDYSPTRDLELLETFMATDTCCQVQSLLVAMQHHDTAIFDRLRMSPTLRYNGVVEWFHTHHGFLFDQLCTDDALSDSSSSYLKLFLSVPGIYGKFCEHGEARNHQCLHRLLQHRAHDRQLLDICLNFISEIDYTSSIELALTVSCFCDAKTTEYVLSSKPFTTSRKLTSTDWFLDPVLPFSAGLSVQMPTPNFDATRFSDHGISQSLIVFFQRYPFLGATADILTTRLLHRHLEELSRCIGDKPWPFATVEFLLSQCLDAASPAFEACLSLARSSQQWSVLRQLLNREIPVETIFNSFEPDFKALSLTALEILLESTAMSSVNERVISLLQESFEFACRSHDYLRSLLLASKLPKKFRITNVLDNFKDAMSGDSAKEWFPMLLKASATSPADLAILWQHLDQERPKSQWSMQALLSAGVTGAQVANTLLCNVARRHHAIVSVILDYWDTDRSLTGRASFDFKKRLHASRVETPGGEVPSSATFYRTLGYALSTAIRYGDMKMCRLLIKASAPLVRGGKIIIVDAVKLVDADTLLTFISMCTYLDDFGTPGVDFALLEAVKCARADSVKAMVNAGGSVLAYGCECLRIATELACSGHMEMLNLLTTLRPTNDTLSFIAEEATRKLKSLDDNAQIFYEIFDLLHEKGLEDVTCYNQALVDLCGMKSTKWDYAQAFISYGACVTWSGGACMRRTWRGGNLQLFPQLFHQCQDQSVLDAVFESAISDHTSGVTPGHLQSHEDALVVLAPLLVTDLPPQARNKALSKVASLSKLDVAMLELMLQTGACVTEYGGETLYRLCRHSHGRLLMAQCHPPITARLQALKLLFTVKDSSCKPGINLTDWKRDDPDHSSLDLLLWPDTTPDASVNTKDQAALFDTILKSVSHNSRYDLIKSFLHTLQGFGFIATYCRRIGSTAMEDLLSASIMTAQEDHHDRQIDLILRALQISAPRVLAGFELQRIECEQFFDCLSDQENHNSEQQVNATAMYLPAKTDGQASQSVEGDGFIYRFDMKNSNPLECEQQGSVLSRTSMSRLLFVALSHKRLSSLVSTLLDCGADPNAIDSEGRSALYMATSVRDSYCLAMRELVVRGASADDGSLHLATCNQDIGAIEILLCAGHSLGHRSPLHRNSTVLEAFLRYDHPEAKKKTFVSTLKTLLHDADWGAMVWQARPNLSGVALEGRWPMECVSALLEFRPVTGVKTTLLRRGRFRHSLLSAVKRWDTDVRLDDAERQQLITRLVKLGFKERYYACEGNQPKDAVGIPDRLLDADSRSRLQAWQEKECSVCGDKPEEPKDIYAHLSVTCMPKHGWQNEIICIDCLRQCLESRMFPSGDERFPSDQILCWAPNCGEVLSHPSIQKYTETNRFGAYDEALCQKLLHAGQSMAKCSGKDCKGAIWLDPVNDKNVTVFGCPVCKHRTCVQCNQPYRNHANKPCPAGDAAKVDARRKEEEKLTKAFMGKEKKCPKCKMPYHRTAGCDHITCGKDTHSSARSCKSIPPSFELPSFFGCSIDLTNPLDVYSGVWIRILLSMWRRL